MGLSLNDLLRIAGLDPTNVSVVLHTTSLEPLRSMLPWIVEHRSHLFDAYQSVHSRKAEATLSDRPYVASFVPLPGARMLFAGLFRVEGMDRMPDEIIFADPRFDELVEQYGATDVAPARYIAAGGSHTRFQLAPVQEHADLRGRLQIAPPPGRAYVRIAANLRVEVLAISAESLFDAAVPEWRAFIVSGPQVRALPESWARRLAEWRGVYVIVDEVDGARYVGSAYGTENLLRRWRAHVARDHGVTRELKDRDPRTFRFAILERLAPDCTPEEAVRVENGWKERLDTIRWGLNTA